MKTSLCLSFSFTLTALIAGCSGYAQDKAKPTDYIKGTDQTVICPFVCENRSPDARLRTTSLTLINPGEKIAKFHLAFVDSRRMVAHAFAVLEASDLDEIDVCRTLDQRLKRIPETGFVHLIPFDETFPLSGSVWTNGLSGRFDRTLTQREYKKADAPDLVNQSSISVCQTVPAGLISRTGLARWFFAQDPVSMHPFYINETGPGPQADSEGGSSCSDPDITCGEGEGSGCVDDNANINGPGSIEGTVECGGPNMAGETICGCFWSASN